jgi:predicted DNA-binding transcriptional regulator YafY
LLPDLFAARRARAAITFTYNDRERTIDPYAVFFTNGYWYVVGWCHWWKGERVFRVDRIDGDIAAGPSGTFEVPSTFNVSEVLPAPWELPGDEPVMAEVRVDASLGPFVAASLGDSAVVRSDADGFVVSFEVRNRGAFRSWLFGMLDDAEVIGPPELRAETIAWLEAVAQ